MTLVEVRCLNAISWMQWHQGTYRSFADDVFLWTAASKPSPLGWERARCLW